MGILWRLLAPKPLKKARRTVRRAAHPVRTASWALSPKPLKQMRRATFKVTHPVEVAEFAAENAIVHAVRGSKRRGRRRTGRPGPRATARYDAAFPPAHLPSEAPMTDDASSTAPLPGDDETGQAPPPSYGPMPPGYGPPGDPAPGANQPGWQPPGYQRSAGRAGHAVAALVLGITGIFLLLPAPFAVGFGVSGLRRSRRQQASGKGMAIAGLVLGIIGSVLFAAVAVSAAISPGTGSKPAAARTTPAPSASATKSPAVVLTAAEQKFSGDVHRYTAASGASGITLAAMGQHVCTDRRAGDSQAAVVRYVRSQLQLRRAPAAAVAILAEKDLCSGYLPAPPAQKISTPPPTTPPAVAESLRGAPANPYHLNLCGRGSLVYSPPSDVCSYFSCIPNFPNGTGFMVECNDGMYSMSGGRQGACSYHGGEGMAVTQG